MVEFRSGENIAHAYIVASPSAEARGQMAMELAAAMLCEGAGVRPCRRCRACAKAFRGVHPDLRVVEPERTEKKTEMKIGQIRQIAATAYLLPSEARVKVYVLRQADKMNPNAQNAFLKLLEEPPRSAAFVLEAENPALLLPTVRSRCELLRENAEAAALPEDARGAAAEYLRLAARGERCALLRWCAAHESMDAQSLADFLAAGQEALADSLAADGAALPPRTAAALLERFARCERYRRANVNGKHIFGLLSLPTDTAEQK